MIEVIRPYIKDDALLRSLDEATLMGFFIGELYEEAEAQAREWIESAGYDRSSARVRDGSADPVYARRLRRCHVDSSQPNCIC